MGDDEAEADGATQGDCGKIGEIPHAISDALRALTNVTAEPARFAPA